MDGDLVKIFKAIGNERRFLIMNHLFGARELSVGQISELIDLSFRSTSKHLSVLVNSGLIKSKQVSFNKIYFINPKIPKDISKFFQS